MTTRVDIGFGSDDVWVVGASREFTIPIKDASGNSKVLTGSSVANWRLTDISPLEGTPNVLIEKTLGAGVALTQFDAVVSVDEADSIGLKPGDYYHELQIVDADTDTDSTTKGAARLSDSLFAS